MKTKLITPEREEKKRPDYPYLAVYHANTEYDINDVVVIYKEGGGAYAKPLTTGISTYLTPFDELGYLPLPSGTVIELVQE